MLTYIGPGTVPITLLFCPMIVQAGPEHKATAEAGPRPGDTASTGAARCVTFSSRRHTLGQHLRSHCFSFTPAFRGSFPDPFHLLLIADTSRRWRPKQSRLPRFFFICFPQPFKRAAKARGRDGTWTSAGWRQVLTDHSPQRLPDTAFAGGDDTPASRVAGDGGLSSCCHLVLPYMATCSK